MKKARSLPDEDSMFRAFTRIREGTAVAESAMEADFGLVSGFCEALRRVKGGSPRGAREQHALRVEQVPSPLGPLIVAGDKDAVWLVEFGDRRMLERQFAALRKRSGVEFFPGQTEPMRLLDDELAAYFAGDLTRFTTPLRFPGTPHQERVWRALADVPYGTTRTYGELARRTGRPSAARAVARAVGDNRLAVVLPCHRVVGADGRLTGYAGGLWRKRCLLALESGRDPGSV